MKIITVKTEKDSTYSIDDKVKVKFFPIINDEEDKNNPIEKEVTIKDITPTDDGCIKLICVDENGNEDYFFEDNII